MPLRIERLRPCLRPLEDVERIELGRGVAAVALLLYEHGDDVELLLVKRRENPRDPWSGQVALPGGRWEPGDSSLLSTVMREVSEEVGINLESNSKMIGALPDARPLSSPEVRVVPLLALLYRKPEVKLSEELSSYFWVGLKSLDVKEVEVKGYDGAVRKVPAFVHGEYVVWGLTARILESFLNLLKSSGAWNADRSKA